MMLELTLALALAAVDAPITDVTVFTDQARVTRTAKARVTGTLAVEFPTLRDTIDQGSIRVEARGAEVRRVDIERLPPGQLQTTEARALIAELESVTLDVARLGLERDALARHQGALQRIAPTLPPDGTARPAPKLNGTGWAQAAQFSSEQLAATQERLRDTERRLTALLEKRQALVEKAQKLGEPQDASGWRVVAHLAGSGPATVQLVYLTRQARWTPTWDLRLQPESSDVALSLAGLVSQETGEDWTRAALVLSTAIPASAVKAPELATWKIGVADRFIPTPTPRVPGPTPAPPVQPLATPRSGDDLLREQLAFLAGLTDGDVTMTTGATADTGGGRRPPRDQMKGESFEKPPSEYLVALKKTEQADAPPPPVKPMAIAEADAMPVSFSASGSARPMPTTSFSLSPPPAWRPPSYGPDSPVTLARGYDLAFTALHAETVESAKGARRVPLWASKWPVKVERRLYPALTKDAFLVAELRNPSKEVLPGGPAQLSVGADPSGTARLELVSPGETFTLPLGIDRALVPVRNVQLVESTTGVFSKSDVGTYTVTIEVANPYKTPVTARVYDQYPVSDQKEVETKLVASKPQATSDATKGQLEWRVTLPPGQKTVLSFTYTLERPKGWQLGQTEVAP